MPTPTSAGQSASTSPRPGPQQAESIKDTLISIIIAFTLAFVFRGFVIEAFVIPTGSMAPTLMGAHMRFQGPRSGYSWPVGPWDTPRNNDYAPVQNDGRNPIVVHDPMTGETISKKNVPLRSGDRILVLKYLYTVMSPRRFDVVVFKNPTDPSVNYIKRLIGLPGEEIALVDGDVFTRASNHGPDDPSKSLWEQSGWAIARKTRAQQRAVWQAVCDSSFGPIDEPEFAGPWNSEQKTWRFSGGEFRYDGTEPTELFFDKTRRRFKDGRLAGGRGATWAIDDRYAYDETPGGGWELGSGTFPVSDLRMRAGVEPRGTGALKVEAMVRVNGMDFQAVIEGGAVTLRTRERVGDVQVLGAWKSVASGTIEPLRVGRVTDVEFCHVDQSLQLYVDGVLAARYDYDWNPAERVAATTGQALSTIMAKASRGIINPLADPELYKPRGADVRWGISGGAVTLHRVGIDRDLHYQPAPSLNPQAIQNPPGLGTAPDQPLTLSGDQFFCCGDNSPQSLDGRLWGMPEPWVAFEFDESPGVVPRDLMLGKAFFVYWPAPHWNGVPIPDFGRMRFIR